MPKSRALARSKETPSSGPPVDVLRDFAEPVIRKEILKKTLMSNVTVWPAAAGICGVLGIVFLGPIGACVALAAGGIVVAVGNVAVGNTLRYFTLRQRHVDEIRKRLEAENERKRRNLREDLLRCRDIPDAAEYVDQCVAQFDNVAGQFAVLEEMLRIKLSQGELTFARFIGSAQQLALNIIDNIRTVVMTLAAIRGIDPKIISKGLQKLSRQSVLSPSDEREKQALEARERIRKEALDRANDLADSNEDAVTALIEATANLGKMKSGGDAEIELEAAMEDIRRIAERCAKYGEVPRDIAEGG